MTILSYRTVCSTENGCGNGQSGMALLCLVFVALDTKKPRLAIVTERNALGFFA